MKFPSWFSKKNTMHPTVDACVRSQLRTHEQLWDLCLCMYVCTKYVCCCRAQDYIFMYTYVHIYIYWFIIGSAEALIFPILCVRYFRWEREIQREREKERERERERRKWRHHRRAKIGDEFTLSLAKNSHNNYWRWAYTFPCQILALFVSPFTLPASPFAERSPCMVALKFAISSHFPLPKIFRPQALFPLFQMARAARRVIENSRQMIKFCPVLFFFPSKKRIKLIPKTIGNRKRDCAWGGSGW